MSKKRMTLDQYRNWYNNLSPEIRFHLELSEKLQNIQVEVVEGNTSVKRGTKELKQAIVDSFRALEAHISKINKSKLD